MYYICSAEPAPAARGHEDKGTSNAHLQHPGRGALDEASLALPREVPDASVPLVPFPQVPNGTLARVPEAPLPPEAPDCTDAQGTPWSADAQGLEEDAEAGTQGRANGDRGDDDQGGQNRVPAELMAAAELARALGALEDVRERLMIANKKTRAGTFAAAARALGGQRVLMRWRKKKSDKKRGRQEGEGDERQKFSKKYPVKIYCEHAGALTSGDVDQRLAERWWPGTIKVHEGQMYLISRPNGRKRPHTANTTYHSVPSHLAEIKLLPSSEHARVLLASMLSAHAIDPKSDH